MTKRYSYFKSELTDLFVISDELHKETFSGVDDEYNCSRIVRKLNTLTDENEQLKQQLKLEEAEERINCRNCIYFISGSSSDSCLKREDIGYKGTCIDGMDYHYLAKNCPYY